MPDNFCSVNFVNDYVTISPSNSITSNNYVTYIRRDDAPTITGSKTFTTTVAPEIWESPNNPYFDYVSEIKNLTKNINVVYNQVYINNEFASYRKLAELIQKFVDIHNRYKNMKIHNEPEMKGDEFDE